MDHIRSHSFKLQDGNWGQQWAAEKEGLCAALDEQKAAARYARNIRGLFARLENIGLGGVLEVVVRYHG